MYNCIDMPPDVARSYHLAATEDWEIPPNDSSVYRIIGNAKGVKNTEEKRHNQWSPLLEDGKDDSCANRGLVKSLLIGAAVLTGIGALATGGYYFMAGRASSGRSELTLPLRPLPSVVNNIPIARVDIDHSSLTTEATSLPYSYYESIYGSTSTPPLITTTEKALTTTEVIVTTTEKSVTTTEVPITTTTALTTTTNPVTTTEALLTTITKQPETTIISAITSKNVDPIATASPRPTSEYMTIKPTEFSTIQAEAEAIEKKHAAGRRNYLKKLQSTQGKYNYPFGTKFFNELYIFCLAETKYDIERAYQGDQEVICKSLDDINDKIADMKEREALVLRINADKETLSDPEYHEEIMLRRKLVTLHLAAETIIDKKDFATFRNKVNHDYKRHFTLELKQREQKIIDYFPEHC